MYRTKLMIDKKQFFFYFEGRWTDIYKSYIYCSLSFVDIFVASHDAEKIVSDELYLSY